MDYGAQVLSHPLIVDAADHHFIPVCVYNNTAGDDDARVLKSFKEPAWNNPVVRIMDFRKRELADRITERWTVEALSSAMVEALGKNKDKVPTFLKLLAEEETSKARGVETAVFGMG